MSIYLGTINGIDLHFHAEPEFESVESMFPDDTPKQLAKTINKIERGEWVFFCAKVSASVKGIDLCDAYLGGCIYESYEQFCETPGYIDDMKQEAYQGAVDRLTEICNVDRLTEICNTVKHGVTNNA